MEKLTATISLEPAQWACLFLMLHNSAPMVPGCLWEETDAIEKTISNALKGASISADIDQAISQELSK